MKRILVLGAAGFIGTHLVRRLVDEGHQVTGVDQHDPRFEPSAAHRFLRGDLRARSAVLKAFTTTNPDEIYQLAADMGGAGFVFTGEHDYDIMQNSARINLNVAWAAATVEAPRLFFASSACVYPQENQRDPLTPNCAEGTAYPANPDSEYGWEKLYAERLYAALRLNRGVETRIGRFHNIFGPLGTYRGGREKAPAAICRKVALAADGDAIEVWGDGNQTRSFLYVDEAVEATLRLTRSDVTEPVNIGSEEMVSIRRLVGLIAGISGKRVTVRPTAGPTGVRGRTSSNALIRARLGWAPSTPLIDGLRSTYAWIENQLRCAA